MVSPFKVVSCPVPLGGALTIFQTMLGVEAKREGQLEGSLSGENTAIETVLEAAVVITNGDATEYPGGTDKIGD